MEQNMESNTRRVRIKIKDVDEEDHTAGTSDRNDHTNILKRKSEDKLELNYLKGSKKITFGPERELVAFSETGDLSAVRLHDDNSLDIADFYDKFTENGTKPIACSTRLAIKLRQNGDPLRKKPGIETSSGYIFVISLWDNILKTSILEGTSTPKEVIMLCHTFIPDMLFHGEETNFERFPCYVKWIAEYGLRLMDEWSDLPAVLRMLAPINENLLNLNVGARHTIFSEMLKRVPHGVLMMPWRDFNAQKFLPIKTANDVSNRKR